MYMYAPLYWKTSYMYITYTLNWKVGKKEHQSMTKDTQIAVFTESDYL